MDSPGTAGPPSSSAAGDAQQPVALAVAPPQPQPMPPPPQQLSRYESQKRRDWNTFLQYLRNHRPPLTLARCSGAHVIEFLKYLDQFGKTKVHASACPFFGHPSPPAPCPCPLRQAWGSLDALVGRLRAAYEENGGSPESNPFAARAVRLYLREVRDGQAGRRRVDELGALPGAAQPDVDCPVAPLLDGETAGQVVVPAQGARQGRREGADEAVAAVGRRGQEEALLDVVDADQAEVPRREGDVLRRRRVADRRPDQSPGHGPDGASGASCFFHVHVRSLDLLNCSCDTRWTIQHAFWSCSYMYSLSKFRGQKNPSEIIFLYGGSTFFKSSHMQILESQS